MTDNSIKEQILAGLKNTEGHIQRLGEGSIPRLDFHRARQSLMVRAMDGSIFFWNTAAEQQYGWSKKEAVGNVSHTLLDTVFPCPLDEINEQLVTKGFWEGELIHRLSDGRRVKVFSKWVLEQPKSEAVASVVEINDPIETLRPETAYLKQPLSVYWRSLVFLNDNWRWWLIPLVVVVIAMGLLVEFTHNSPLIPLSE